MNTEIRQRHPFRTMFVLGLLLFVAAGVICYANGWVRFNSTSETATIELKTGEIKEAASDMKAKGGELLEKTGKAVKEAGQAVSGNEPAASKPDETSTTNDGLR